MTTRIMVDLFVNDGLYVQVVHEVNGRTVRSHAEWNGE